MPARFDHVGLSVADLDAAARWYSDVFSLISAVPFALEALGLRGVFLLDGAGGAMELLERKGSRPQASEALEASANDSLLSHGFRHVCLRVDDVQAVHARALAAGATERMAPKDAPEPGVRMSFIADPEGNLVELLDRAGPVGGASAN